MKSDSCKKRNRHSLFLTIENEKQIVVTEIRRLYEPERKQTMWKSQYGDLETFYPKTGIWETRRRVLSRLSQFVRAVAGSDAGSLDLLFNEAPYSTEESKFHSLCCLYIPHTTETPYGKKRSPHRRRFPRGQNQYAMMLG